MGRYGIGAMPQGRARLDGDALAAVRAEVQDRAQGRCEACGGTAGPFEQHHVIPRSRGGADAVWNLLNLCPRDHALVDAPYATGRLLTELVRVRSAHDRTRLMTQQEGLASCVVVELRNTEVQPDAIRVSWAQGPDKWTIREWKFIRFVWVNGKVG